jgi:hypothetical protein
LGDAAIQIHNFYACNEPCSRKPLYAGGLLEKPVHWLFYRVIRRGIRRRRSLKIITLVRDPIGRNVSMFFQDLHYWLAYYFSRVRRDRAHAEGVDVLVDCFRSTFDHRYPLDWFDRELKRLTGIDVYEHAFDHAAGYMRIDKGRVSVLVVHSEKLRESWPAIEEFCGRKLVPREDNRGARKWYARSYSEFLETYVPSKAELDEMYSSRYATFFFSDEARAELRRRWSRDGAQLRGQASVARAS